MKNLTPNLMVENVTKTIDFYKEVLHFELVVSVPTKGKIEWALMRCGYVEIMFQSRSSLGGEIIVLKDTEIGGSLTLYFEIRDIEELYDRIKDRVEIVKELHTTFYGMMEFAMKDCNGYILAFADRP